MNAKKSAVPQKGDKNPDPGKPPGPTGKPSGSMHLPEPSSEELLAKAMKLSKTHKDQSARMTTTFQSQQQKTLHIDVSTEAATRAEEAHVKHDRHYRLTDAVKELKSRDAKKTTKLEGGLAKEVDSIKDKETNLEKEAKQIDSQLKKDSERMAQDLSVDLRRMIADGLESAVKLAQVRQQQNSIAQEKGIMIVEHSVQSAGENFDTRVKNYGKRDAKDYGEERAALELQKLMANPSYLPMLPPGEFSEWNGKSAWLKILNSFLDILTYHLATPADWPINLNSWYKGLREAMQAHLLPYCKMHWDTIIELGGANTSDQAEFEKAILNVDNRTFVRHHQESKGLGDDSYYTNIYAGIIGCLRVQKDMEEAALGNEEDDNIPDVAPENPAAVDILASRYASTLFANNLVAGFKMEQNKTVRAEIEFVLSSVLEQLNNGGDEDSHSGAAGESGLADGNVEESEEGSSGAAGTSGHAAIRNRSRAKAGHSRGPK